MLFAIKKQRRTALTTALNLFAAKKLVISITVIPVINQLTNLFLVLNALKLFVRTLALQKRITNE